MGPRDHLALGTSHSHITVVAVAANVIAAANVAVPMTLHELCTPS
jgi:hypothetical protein